MKLFDDKFEKAEISKLGQSQSAKNKQADHILIISDTKSVSKNVCSYLTMNNINSYRVCEIDFFKIEDNEIIGSARSVIIDIASETDVELIIKRTTLLIPNIVRTILIGDNDSILFSQSMKHAGFNYLHREYQIQSIIGLLAENDEISTNANQMKISVLGCKGGIGTSTVAYDLFQSLTKLSSIPTLLVQGCSGSSDLDLIMEQVLPRDGSIFYAAGNSAVKFESTDSSWSYSDSIYNRFNLIIFEHSMVGGINDKFETIFGNSQTIILVLNRNLTCLRVAKKIIDEHKRNFTSRPTTGQKLIVCMNENTPQKADDMKNEDIES